jgi:hypothetical protein
LGYTSVLGPYLRFNPYENSWQSTFPGKFIPSFDELDLKEHDSSCLKEGERLRFRDLILDSDPKFIYLRTMYVFEKGKEGDPTVMLSAPITLKH